MDTTVLVNYQYEEGKKLIEKLDASGNRYPIALWINIPETNDWTLMLGIPHLNNTGSKNIFKLIHNVIATNNIDISLNNISLNDTTSDLCRALRATVKTGMQLGKMSFFGNFINGQRFPDAIIYRVN